MGLISNGTTVFDAGAMSLGGSLVFIKKLTASNSATLSFVHGSGGVDFSTYKEYLFTFKNVHHSTDGEATFSFQGSIDAGSNYNVEIQSSMAQAYHGEDGGGAAVNYYTGGDQANGTGFQLLNGGGTGGDNDQSCNGYLHLFNPSSTTFVKNFVAVTNIYQDNNQSNNAYTAGYLNTTSDIDAIRFAPGRDTGPTILATGDICMYGIA